MIAPPSTGQHTLTMSHMEPKSFKTEHLDGPSPRAEQTGPVDGMGLTSLPTQNLTHGVFGPSRATGNRSRSHWNPDTVSARQIQCDPPSG